MPPTIPIKVRHQRPLRCHDMPTGVRCTNRLYDGECPGAKAKGGQCSSSKFDATKHSADLPKFFVAQH